MRVLITGIAGFIGSHLADYILSQKDVELYGTFLKYESLENLTHIKDQLVLRECDIMDQEQLDNIIKESLPDCIFHLAAQSNVVLSWQIPQKTVRINVEGTVNLLESARKHVPDARIMLASSREVYGAVKKSELPITEEHQPEPINPYAVSKLAMEFLGYNYYYKYGLKSIILRSFNITGPRRPESFVCSDWAKQVAQIELGLKEQEIRIGNLNAIRDFTDVRDAVRAYWLAIKKCKPAEPYNLCSGRALKMKEILDMILSLSDKDIKVVRDEKKVVKIDVPYVAGTNKKLRKATGWKPKIRLEKTLKDLVDYWKEKLNS